ncbi:MAG: divalent-cation tolerance protein CutA [Candidatus Omnitrophota bacterium]|jgi:periplasmic divalent cation tolerance protein
MQIVVFITAADKKEAGRISRALVEKRLAACVNIIDKIESVFWWQKKIDCACEALLIVKSKAAKLNQVIKLVKSLHSYRVPEIIALPIIGGSRDYLRWLDESLR